MIRCRGISKYVFTTPVWQIECFYCESGNSLGRHLLYNSPLLVASLPSNAIHDAIFVDGYLIESQPSSEIVCVSYKSFSGASSHIRLPGGSFAAGVAYGGKSFRNIP